MLNDSDVFMASRAGAHIKSRTLPTHPHLSEEDWLIKRQRL